MNKIILGELDLKVFTEQDASDYCILNDLYPDDITQISLYNNRLTDISGIKIFKNLNVLWLSHNKLINISVSKDLNNIKILNISYNEIKDISVIQYLNNLEILNIENLKLESDQIQYINSLKNLKTLICKRGFKDMNILKEINKNLNIKK